jgi:hypothetical protein
MNRQPSVLRRLVATAALLTVLVLQGCGQTSLLSREDAGVPPRWYDIPTHELVASVALPAGLKPLQMRERYWKPNWMEQHVVLSNASATANENYLHVKVAFSAGQIYDEFFGLTKLRTFIEPMSEDALAAKLAKEFPDAETVIASAPADNALGPYLWASTVDYQGTSCALVWQFADDDRDGMPSGVNAVWVELRVCDPTLSTAQIVGALGNLHLDLLAKNRLSPLYQQTPTWQQDRRRIDDEPAGQP